MIYNVILENSCHHFLHQHKISLAIFALSHGELLPSFVRVDHRDINYKDKKIKLMIYTKHHSFFLFFIMRFLFSTYFIFVIRRFLSFHFKIKMVCGFRGRHDKHNMNEGYGLCLYLWFFDLVNFRMNYACTFNQIWLVDEMVSIIQADWFLYLVCVFLNNWRMNNCIHPLRPKLASFSCLEE